MEVRSLVQFKSVTAELVSFFVFLALRKAGKSDAHHIQLTCAAWEGSWEWSPSTGTSELHGSPRRRGCEAGCLGTSTSSVFVLAALSLQNILRFIVPSVPTLEDER